MMGSDSHEVEAAFKRSPLAVCLDVMIVQELQCFPHGPELGSAIEQVFAHCGSAPHYAGWLMVVQRGACMRSFPSLRGIDDTVRRGQRGSGRHREQLEL